MKTIFVSSTFQDMQLERDALQRISLPGINAVAKAYADKVAMCDLRWGVNTSGLSEVEGNQKVLDYCLDAIDRCEPIMIILLGERYGWIPDEKIVHAVTDRKQLQLEDYAISVTALEIEYGAFFRKARTLVYFREFMDDAGEVYGAEDPAHAQKLQQLKEKLQLLCPEGVRTYPVSFDEKGAHGIDEFAEMVRRDVCELLEEQWKETESLSDTEKELRIHRSLYADCAEAFQTGEAFLQEATAAVRTQGGLVNICGGAGSGKTVMMGKLAQELAAAGYDVLPIQVGATPQASVFGGVLKAINGYFREELGYICQTDLLQEQEATPYYEKDIKQVSLMDVYRTIWNKSDQSAQEEALREYVALHEASGRKLVILIDGTDLFHDDRAESARCFIPDNIHELQSICMVLSSNEEIQGLRYTHLHIPEFTREENKKIVESILGRNNRELDDAVMEDLLRKCAGKPPIYIQFLLQRMFMMNAHDFAVMKDMDTISAHQRELIAAACDDLQDLGFDVLREGAARISCEFLTEVLYYLALSQEGLTESELETLCGSSFDKADFYNFIAYMGDHFVLRQNGRYDYANACIQEKIAREMPGKERYAQKLLKLLTDNYLHEQLASGQPDFAVVQEIAYVCLTHCPAEVLQETVFLFDNAQRSYDWQEGEMLPAPRRGMLALCSCLSDHSRQLQQKLVRLAKAGAAAREEEKLETARFFELLEEGSVDGEVLSQPELCQTWLELLEGLGNRPGPLFRAARLAKRIYDACCQREDAQAEQRERLFLQVLTRCREALPSVYISGENDAMEILSEMAAQETWTLKFCDDTRSQMEKLLEQCQGYMQEIIKLPSDKLDEDTRNQWHAKYVYCCYAHFKFIAPYGEPAAVRLRGEFMILLHGLTTPAVQAEFDNKVSGGQQHLWRELASAAGEIAQRSRDKKDIRYALKCEKQLRRKGDKQEQKESRISYLRTCSRLYDLAENKYRRKSARCLKKILKLPAGDMEKLGDQFFAADSLYLRTGKIRYAEKAVDIMLAVASMHDGLKIKYTCDEVTEYMLFLEDPAVLYNAFYMSFDLLDDLTRALELCQELRKKGLEDPGRAVFEDLKERHMAFQAEKEPELLEEFHRRQEEKGGKCHAV